MFNYTHSSLRTCVERTFKVLKNRFKILREASLFPIEKQLMILVACAVIHNFNCIHKPDDRLLRQYNIDGHTVQEVDPQICRRRDDGDDDVPDCIEVPNIVAGQNAMSTISKDMANQMFAAFERNPWYRWWKVPLNVALENIHIADLLSVLLLFKYKICETIFWLFKIHTFYGLDYVWIDIYFLLFYFYPRWLFNVWSSLIINYLEFIQLIIVL